MRTLFSLVLCFLSLTVCRADAQETFAPLISENCMTFVHVDFSNVEIDTIKNTFQKTGEDFLRQLSFDDRSFKATALELSIELEKLDARFRPTYETLTKELGIREYAVILDMDIWKTNRGIGVVAFPWKNKTDKQYETLLDLLEKTGNPAPRIRQNIFTAGDFVFLPIADNAEAVKSIVNDWLTKNKAVQPSSPILEAMQNVPEGEIKFAFALPESLRGMVQNAPLPSGIPVEMRNLLMFAAKKIQWASGAVSPHEFLGSEPPKNANVLLTVKTTKRSDAVMLRSMLEQLIEFGANATRYQMEQNARDSGGGVPMLFQSPLVYQFLKGLLRTLLPDVEEEKLVFRAKGDSHQAVVAAVAMSTAIGLPAIQSARESARKMQCMNHIKQLVLAMHNYHDVHDSLPPLYTVDENGKPLHSWRVLLLPYMEQTALYQKIRLDEPWDSEYNKQFHNSPVSIYRCPSNPEFGEQGTCTYVAIAGEGLIPSKKAGPSGTGASFADITDGLSNTIAVIEVKEPFCWMDPMADVSLDELAKGINRDGRCGSFHPYGCNVGAFDGRTHFINESEDLQTLRALGTCAGGESVGF